MVDGWPCYARIDGPLVIVGFGSIGQGLLPLILRHFEVQRDNIVIVSADERGQDVASEHGIRFIREPLTPSNLEAVLAPLFDRAGGFLVNLSVEVESMSLVRFCHKVDALYIDTCIEPWPGRYEDPDSPMGLRTNYSIREDALAMRDSLKGGPTAILAHGANPGLVSHFVKQALLNIAADCGLEVSVPETRQGWGELARKLGVKGIHIAERDTQVADEKKQKGEFVNTWSIDGFLAEGLQPAELGWGTHEGYLPANAAEHVFGCRAAIYLKKPGASTRVRSWTPMAGSMTGFLITHNEAISIADYFSLFDADERVTYRPTCHYVYHPCDDAVLSLHELEGNAFEAQTKHRLICDEITDGVDELGVLVYGHEKNAYWYGSQLSIHETRELIPHQNATGLQVTATVLAGMVWAIENPKRGLVEADEIDFKRILDIAGPYLGPVVGEYTDWTPLDGRTNWIFPEEIDESDPWRFTNVLLR
ncbi:homospermidine synthase [Kordiimonas lipolytica]|uniref:Homospermidine synthase n=1 Tax=Kordiimonas lipolytica TaxID=1662421 RepID=A0ABV8UCW7_9PROT|nr:saccharopine dehydrogenase C-terminal domain-containing protein [Kordiimonas lipolytica]